MKNIVKIQQIFLGVLFIGITQIVHSQGYGAATGHGYDTYVINTDRSNHRSEFRMQTGQKSFTFSHMNGRMGLFYQSNYTGWQNRGGEIFSVNTNGSTTMSNAFVGNIGHGSAWAGFAHKSQVGTTNYSFLAEKNGNRTLINKKNTGTGYIGFRIGNIDKMVFTNSGKLGIGTTNPKGDLQFANKIKNRKIVLWQDGDNDHSFYGFGVNSSTLRYQSSYHHVFYSKENDNSSKEVFRINNDGKIVIGQSQLNSITNGTTTMLTVSGGITTGDVGAEKLKADKVDTETIEIGQSKLSSSTENANTLLTVTGGVKTDKVILNIGTFPDYVFADEYPLMPIEEVADYITKNKHLPNIPSEKEMITIGLDVTAISVKLVEKIEELTLYTIQQQQLINTLVKRLEKLEKSK